ncbi:MAG: hypothetical protein ACKVRP_07790 [Bacteroidota bacterium]
MIKRHLFEFCLAALVAVSSGCKDDVTGDGGSPSNIVFPLTDVSYSVHVQPLFNQTCALAGCHDDATPDRARLTSHTNVLFANPQIVVEGSPDQSILVLRIEGRLGQNMPLNRNPLNQNQINGIRAWIAEGARNN